MEQQYKPAVLIFTYRGDEALTPICVKFAKATLGNDTQIVVADDGFNAVSKSCREELISLGCNYIQTDWPRNGNLLGPDHLKGATRLMAQLSRGCDIIVKLDADACLLRRDWIDTLHQDNIALITSAYKTRITYPMGNSYAVKSQCCDSLAKDCELFEGWTGCFEDYEIGTRISRLLGGNPAHAIRYQCNIKDGFVLTNPWDIDYQQCLDYCRVYCSGYQYGSTPYTKQADYKQEQVKVHSKLLEMHLERLKVNSEVPTKLHEFKKDGQKDAMNQHQQVAFNPDNTCYTQYINDDAIASTKVNVLIDDHSTALTSATSILPEFSDDKC